VKDELSNRSSNSARPDASSNSAPDVSGKLAPDSVSSSSSKVAYPRTYGFSGGLSAKEIEPQYERLSGSLWEDYRRGNRASRRPTVLLVYSDEVKNRELTTDLELDGYLTVPTADAAEALQLAKLLSLDLVICSIDMVNRDSGYFIRHLRKTPNHADVPVIVVSAEAPEEEESYLKLGADALCIEAEAEQSVLALAAFYLEG
jgi:CheY-like chemotaxis protein